MLAQIDLDGRSFRARVRSGGKWQERTSASGYASSSLDAVHFGLEKQTIVPEVEILWPSGTRQVLTNIQAGQTLVVREPARPAN
ncbi:MAG TPA: ASPIC/UnbV domain-containing protein [Bryobacteraceae bacterium]|nr:ASPIC/UnbV domain-containing protein [Bryobacteraceae bacterium]